MSYFGSYWAIFSHLPVISVATVTSNSSLFLFEFSHIFGTLGPTLKCVLKKLISTDQTDGIVIFLISLMVQIITNKNDEEKQICIGRKLIVGYRNVVL